MKKRTQSGSLRKNGSIEIVRIFIAIVIAAAHFNEFFGNNGMHISYFISTFVDFFFILAGFFMLMHLDKNPNADENTWSYCVHKIRSFWAPLCIVNFGHLFLNCCMSGISSIGGVFGKLWHFKWEFLLLQCAGFIQKPAFNQDYLVGSCWYLSALMLATVILYPIARHYRRVYTNVICPVTVLVVYCAFSQAYGNLDIGNGFSFIVMDALIRALAGICFGSICYCAYLWLEKKNIDTTLIVIDCAAWLMLPASIFIAIFGSDDSGLFMIIPFGIIIISSMLNRTPITRTLSRIPSEISSFFGKFSLYIYLAQWTPIFVAKYFMPEASAPVKILAASVTTLVYSIILYFIDKKRKSSTPVLIICSALFAATLVTCGFFIK